LRGAERELILRTLEAVGWVIGGAAGAAAKLGLKRTTLINKMQKLGIFRPRLQSRQDVMQPTVQRLGSVPSV
jgi:formate hydrogenlyase transcriptional activator